MSKKVIGPSFYQFRRNPALSALIVFLGLQFSCVIVSLLYPDQFPYLSEDNVAVILRSIPVLGIISLGVGILMISGEYDLSVGATFTFTSLILAETYLAGLPLALSVLLALAGGVIVGLINAIIVLKFRITSFIATLGTMMMLRGLILYSSGAESKTFDPPMAFKTLLSGQIWVIQFQFLWLLLLAVVAFLVLERHKLGNHIFATGGAAEAANAIGVNVGRVKLICFCLSSLGASVAGVLATTRVNSVSPVQGQGLELQAIAACVIGGVALAGGRGSILGIFLGAAMIFTVQDILLLTSLPGYYLQAFVGLFIVCAAVLNRLVYRED